MNMDNVKKAILYRWMYSIFVTKETPKSEFTNKNAITLLNQAKFNLPYDASVKPFLAATTKEFNDALKGGSIDELLEQYQLPAFLYESDEESKPSLTIDELKAIIHKAISENEDLSGQDLFDQIKEQYTLSMDYSKFDSILEEVITSIASVSPSTDGVYNKIINLAKSGNKSGILSLFKTLDNNEVNEFYQQFANSDDFYAYIDVVVNADGTYRMSLLDAIISTNDADKINRMRQWLQDNKSTESFADDGKLAMDDYNVSMEKINSIEPKEEKPSKIKIIFDSDDEIDEPTNGELYTFISEFIAMSDITELSKRKVIAEVNKQFNFSEGHREKEIKKLIKKVLSEIQLPTQEEQIEEKQPLQVVEEDVIIPDITPKAVKKVKKASVQKVSQMLSSEMSERRGLLRTQYWVLTNRVKSLDTLINMNVDGEEQHTQDIQTRDELIEQIKEIETELESLPGGHTLNVEHIEDKDEIKKAKVSLDKIRSLSERRMVMKNVNNETKNNLKYIAFLSYYLISPNIVVEDPALSDTYNLYPDLETKFKEIFNNLSIKQRLDFIKNLLNGQKLKQIKELIKEGKGFDTSILTSIQNFANSLKQEVGKVQKVTLIGEEGSERSADYTQKIITPPSIDEEIQYNLMFYIQKNIEYSRDVMVRNIVNDIAKRTFDDDKKSIEIKVEKAVGVSEDKQSMTEKVHTAQLANIKSLIRDKYPSEYDEDVRDIQVMYEETRPPLRFTDMEDDLTHSVQSQSLLFSVSGSSEWRSELQLIAKIFRNTAYEKEIYDLKKKMENESFTKLAKSERKSAEYKYVEKKLKAGEISQNAAKGMLAFINMYGTVSKLPSSAAEKRMFEYRRVEDLPEHLRVDAEKELRKRMSAIMIEKKSHIHEQQNILSKIQMELTAERIDLISIANHINSLQTSEEIKNKLLTTIQKNGKDTNVFLTYKNLSRGVLINPLMYVGIQRGKRVRKMKEEMSELDRIKASFPKMNHSIQACMSEVYFKPWLNLPKSFDYYISHPQGYSKESLNDRERFFYGEKIEDGKYRPTTVFWKVYCTEFVLDVNDKYTCNMPNIKRELLDKSTRNYVLGVYDKNTKSSFRELTEEDYKKECEWFEHNYLQGIRTFKNYSVIDLEINVKLGREVRDSMRRQIEEVFKLIYTGRNLATKTVGRAEKNAQKLETAIYEASKVQGKVILYKYAFDVCKFVYLINPSSPLFGFTSFLQELLLAGSKDNYKNIIKLSANIGNIIPEIYLLSDRAEFEELINKQVKKNTIIALKNSSSSFIEPSSKLEVEQFGISIEDKIKDKLATFDHSKFKNVCVNETKDAFFTAEDNDGKLWCVSREDFYKILNNEYSVTLFYPNEVVETVQSLFKVDESSELNRIIVMQYTADEEATKHFKVFSTFKELVETDISEEEFHEVIKLDEFQIAIQAIEAQIGKLSDEELHLYINHLISQGYNTLLNKIQAQIDNTTYPSNLIEQLVTEYKERYEIYYNEQLMNNDKKERLVILRGVFKSLENIFGVIDEDTKELIVDYFHATKIAPLVKNVERKKYGLSSEQYALSCTICNKSVEKSKVTTTYFYKEGKKEVARFCSTKCMSKMGDAEFEIPKSMSEIKIEALIDKLVNPIALTYDELIHRTKLIGMSLPEDIPFIQAYISWLYNTKFEDNIWLNYHHATLDKVASHFNIKENDVKLLWVNLKNNVDFITMFHTALEKVAKPYSKYTKEVITAEVFAGGCDYSKVEVEKWISEIATHFLPSDWKTYSFDKFDFEQNVFRPFFHKFNACGHLKYSVKNYIDAKRNYNFIESIVDYIINEDVERNTQLEKSIHEKYTSQTNETIKEVSKSFKNVDNPLDTIKGMLRKEYNLQKGISLSKAVMNNRDLAHRTIHKALDVEASTSLADAETYKNLLFKVGYSFLNKFVSLMEINESTSTSVKKRKSGRKLPESTKVLTNLQGKLYQLQEELKELGEKNYEITVSINEKNGELSRASEALKDTIENELKELEAAYIETQTKIIGNEMEKKEIEERLVRTEKVVAKGEKKKVFKSSKKAIDEKIESVFTSSSADVITLKKNVEKTLKKLLFEKILDKLPNEMNVYDIAYELGIVEGEPTEQKEMRLTKKMLRGDTRKGKKREREKEVDIEESSNIIDEMGEEIREIDEEKEIQDITIQQEREYEEEDNEKEFDEYAAEEFGGDDEYSY